MPQVNIPGAVSGGGGRQQDPWLQLLMGLLGGAGQMGIQKLMTPSAPAYDPKTDPEVQRTEYYRSQGLGPSGAPPQPPGVQEQLLDDQRAFATQQLQQTPGTPEFGQLLGMGGAMATGGMPSAQPALPGALSRFEQLELKRAEIAEREKAAEAERLFEERRNATLSRLPANLHSATNTLFDAEKAGVEGMGDVIKLLLPESELQKIELARAKVDLDTARAGFARAAREDDLRAEVAEKLGLEAGTVTDGIITDWLRKEKIEDDNSMAERIMTTLISRTDPITGMPSFDPDEAALRTEAAVQTFNPAFQLNLPTTSRDRAFAGGMLSIFLRNRRTQEPNIKNERLKSEAAATVARDFPQLTPEDFEVIWGRAQRQLLFQ